MNIEPHARLAFLLALGLAPLSAGCIRTGGPEWKWQRCYAGPPRPCTDIAILFVTRHSRPVRIRAIDGICVRDVEEYQVLAGNHELVLQLHGWFFGGFPTEVTGAAAPFKCTVAPGMVYALQADVNPGGSEFTNIPGAGVRDQWTPHMEELGRFETLRDTLAQQEARFRTLFRERSGGLESSDIPWSYTLFGMYRPPAHWVSTGHE